MQIRYYETAWRDISNSPGWFGKLCLLALVNFIPVFGQIVTFGYLYGWAREIAWGVHMPLPAKIINNEDGKFWRRGWFALVISFVFALVPGIVASVGQGMQGSFSYASGTTDSALYGIGSVVYLVGVLGALLMSVLAWVGTMRMSIYDRLSAGFQFDKIWKMFRRDTGGIARIFGMNVLFGFVLGIVASIIMTMLVFVALFAGAATLVSSGLSISSVQHMTDVQAAQMLVQMFAASGAVGIPCVLVACFVVSLASEFINMLVVRALGYWTAQFDVPRWRGQDEPLPFEAGPLDAKPAYGAPEASSQAYQAVQPDMQQAYGQAQPFSQPQIYDQAQPFEQQQAFGEGQLSEQQHYVQDFAQQQQPGVQDAPEAAQNPYDQGSLFEQQPFSQPNDPIRTFEQQPTAQPNDPSQTFEKRPFSQPNDPSQAFEQRPSTQPNDPSQSFGEQASYGQGPEQSEDER